MSAHKIIEGIKDAIAGNFSRVTIDGQVWERRADVPSAPRWRHKKRGTFVRELGRGFAQVAAHPIEEMTAVVIYREEQTGGLWVRNAVEFDDGRFEPAALSPHEGEPQ